MSDISADEFFAGERAAELLALADRCEQVMGPDVDLQYLIMTEVMGYRGIHGQCRSPRPCCS